MSENEKIYHMLIADAMDRLLSELNSIAVYTLPLPHGCGVCDVRHLGEGE